MEVNQEGSRPARKKWGEEIMVCVWVRVRCAPVIRQFVCLIVIVIVTHMLLKRHSKVSRMTPAYLRLLCQIRGAVRRVVQRWSE